MEKKILMLGWGFPPKIDGGLDIHVAELFKELREKDIEITLALPEGRAPGIPGTVGLETRSEDILPASKDLSREFVELAQDHDIVHTHDWFGAEAGLKAKKYADVKWVATFHSLSSQRSRSASPELDKRERAMAERSDELIAVSEELAEDVKEKFRREPRVIHNGFSTVENNGKDIKKELKIDGDMIFFVGRHAEQKGIEHLLYGFKKFLEDSNATLVLGGDGHLRESLEKFTEILGIDENVVFTGFIPDERLGDYYSAADVFVSPSINEPFGLTVTEALQAGTPVVSTSAGVEEVLPEGTLVKTNPDSGSIKHGIEKALEHSVPEFKERTWQEMAEEVTAVYRELS